MVDDFGVKYVGKEQADHLIKTLQLHYQLSTNWAGKLYCGIKLEWNYAMGTVDLSMPGYVERALTTFQHPAPNKPINVPDPWTPPNYGAKIQWAEHDTTTPMTADQPTTLRQVIGKFLFYA
jgi:hypothetical protein